MTHLHAAASICLSLLTICSLAILLLFIGWCCTLCTTTAAPTTPAATSTPAPATTLTCRCINSIVPAITKGFAVESTMSLIYMFTCHDDPLQALSLRCQVNKQGRKHHLLYCFTSRSSRSSRTMILRPARSVPLKVLTAVTACRSSGISARCHCQQPAQGYTAARKSLVQLRSKTPNCKSETERLTSSGVSNSTMPHPFDLPAEYKGRCYTSLHAKGCQQSWPFASLEKLCKQVLTTIVPHDVRVDNIPDIPELVFQILPGCLPGKVANVAALANAHDTAILAILVAHLVAAETPFATSCTP